MRCRQTHLEPSSLVMGAIHGNEKCGTIAIDRVMSEIDSGHLKIVKGQGDLPIPIANPKAYELDQRYFERNLFNPVLRADGKAGLL